MRMPSQCPCGTGVDGRCSSGGHGRRSGPIGPAYRSWCTSDDRLAVKGPDVDRRLRAIQCDGDAKVDGTGDDGGNDALAKHEVPPLAVTKRERAGHDPVAQAGGLVDDDARAFVGRGKGDGATCMLPPALLGLVRITLGEVQLVGALAD
jgi:hypothetical protein